MAGLDFKRFEFRGYLGKRRVVSFGWRYDFNHARLQKAEAIPAFLDPVRAHAAAFADVDPDQLEHVLVNEYAPGAGIGWRRDRPQFEDVVGVSLGSPDLLRFRRKRGRWVGAHHSPGAPSIRLPAPRIRAKRVGAQRAGRERAPLFHHLPRHENLRAVTERLPRG